MDSTFGLTRPWGHRTLSVSLPVVHLSSSHLISCTRISLAPPHSFIHWFSTGAGRTCRPAAVAGGTSFCSAASVQRTAIGVSVVGGVHPHAPSGGVMARSPGWAGDSAGSGTTQSILMRLQTDEGGCVELCRGRRGEEAWRGVAWAVMCITVEGQKRIDLCIVGSAGRLG